MERRDALRRRFVNLELAPGALIDEAALADEFGMSRPPMAVSMNLGDPMLTRDKR
ncbi:hypothetical protein [Burkholderia sp. IMCC1007]|uniref:hypothetical protein n=1 Tax=Burkholderia sp. IMCC1007 TaxID=3004104 RepID=UPI002F96B1FB